MEEINRMRANYLTRLRRTQRLLATLFWGVGVVAVCLALLTN